jgi:hypothetical protein
LPALFWLDIPAGHLFRYDPLPRQLRLVLQVQAGLIGGFTIQADGALLLFGERGRGIRGQAPRARSSKRSRLNVGPASTMSSPTRMGGSLPGRCPTATGLDGSTGSIAMAR